MQSFCPAMLGQRAGVRLNSDILLLCFTSNKTGLNLKKTGLTTMMYQKQNSQKSAKSTPVRRTISHSSTRLCRKPQSKRVKESKGGRKKYARNHAKRNSWHSLFELGRGINQRTREKILSQLQN